MFFFILIIFKIAIMRHTKFQPNIPSGYGEKMILLVTISNYDSHLGFFYLAKIFHSEALQCDNPISSVIRRSFFPSKTIQKI